MGPTYEEPYSQHQPLWMALGGLVWRYCRLHDSFVILKLMSLISGIVLILIMARRALRTYKAFLTLLISCFSIALIDFSANGSFYILCALLYYGFCLAMLKGESSGERSAWAVLAGVVGGLSLLTHLISFALVAAALLLYVRGRPRLRRAGLVAGSVMCAMLVLVEVYRRASMGSGPNPSMVSFLVRNGLAAQRVDEGTLSLAVVYGVSSSSLITILTNLLSGARYIISTLVVLSGPLVVFLLIGFYRLIARGRRKALGICLSILIGHFLVMVIFPYNRFRFMVPVAPLVFCVIGDGVEAFRDRRPAGWMPRIGLTQGRIIWLFVALFVGYNLFYLVRYPHTFYDTSRAGTARTYDEMRETAQWFRRNAPSGNVLGFARSLDGGVEAYYFDRFPFVYGRPFIPYQHILPRLVSKYDIEYIWTERDVWNTNEYLRALPVLYRHGRFMILLAHPGALSWTPVRSLGPGRTGDLCDATVLQASEE